MDVLLARAGALGDLLLLRPTLAALRSSGHRVHLLAPLAPGRALVGPGAAETLHASDGPELAAALANGFADGPLARALAAADAVVAFTRSTELLERLAERTRRLIAHDPKPPGAGPHAAAWLARAIAPLVGERELAAATALHAPPLAFTDEERREAEALVRDLPSGFLAVHPGSGAPTKNWPLDRWHEAAALLANGAPWLFAVGPAEAALPPPAGALLAREWPLRTLAAAFSRAGLFVGNDSGVSHLAAAAGTPTLALFGPTDPALWAPVGPRAVSLRAPDGSLDGLAVADVVAAARRLRSAATPP
jgi:heptosyltransferase III